MLLELTALWLLTSGLIWASVQLGKSAEWALAAVPFLFIYSPVLLCRLRKADSWAYRLSIPAFRDGRAWGQALGLTALISVLLGLPFLAAYHVYQLELVPWALQLAVDQGWLHPKVLGTAATPPQWARLVAWVSAPTELAPAQWLASVPIVGAALAGAWPSTWAQISIPDALPTLLAYQIAFVAIPEEFFYRGYFQTRLNEVFPRRWLIFGVPMGWGAVIATLFFAFGHSLVTLQWWHFATFFPGMVFAWMRERTGRVIGGALFHAVCNVGVAFLDIGYGLR